MSACIKVFNGDLTRSSRKGRITSVLTAVQNAVRDWTSVGRVSGVINTKNQVHTSVKTLADLSPGGTRLAILHTNLKGRVLLLHAFVQCLELLDAIESKR
jgi:hypothetical protein